MRVTRLKRKGHLVNSTRTALLIPKYPHWHELWKRPPTEAGAATALGNTSAGVSCPPPLRPSHEIKSAWRRSEQNRKGQSYLASGPFPCTKNGYWSLRTSRARFRDTRARGRALETCYAIIKTRSSYGSETSISLVLTTPD